MSVSACAALVHRGDPDRFLATMAAPPQARELLFPLYALNLEVARAPWVTQEPMIAEMRLQWWRDALEEIATGAPVRSHEVTTPLAKALSPETAARLDELIVARRWDIYKDPFEDQAHFDAYIDHTSGTLLWAAASGLGAVDEAFVRDAAYAQGLANWFRAIPDLEAGQRIPLVDGTPEAIRALASSARARLRTARAHRTKIARPARPALLAVWDADLILKQAEAHPHRVADGTLGQSPAAKRISLMARAATGLW